MTIVSADHIAKWRGGITAALQRTAEEACWNRDPPLDLLVGAASSLVFKHAHGAVPPPPRVLEQAVLAYAGHPVPDPLASEQFYVGLPDFDVGAGHRASPAEQWWAQTVAEALARLRVHPDYCAEPERRRTIAAGMVSAFVQRYLPARQVAGDFWRTQVTLSEWQGDIITSPLYYHGVAEPAFTDLLWERIRGFPMLRAADLFSEDEAAGRVTPVRDGCAEADECVVEVAATYRAAVRNGERWQERVVATLSSLHQLKMPARALSDRDLAIEVDKIAAFGRLYLRPLHRTFYCNNPYRVHQPVHASPHAAWWAGEVRSLLAGGLDAPENVRSPAEILHVAAARVDALFADHWPEQRRSLPFWAHQAWLLQQGLAHHAASLRPHFYGPDAPRPTSAAARLAWHRLQPDFAALLHAQSAKDLDDPEAFDVRYYMSEVHPGRFVSATAARRHYLEIGLPHLGEPGSATLNPRWYLARHPDLVAHFGSTNYREALHHWRDFGRREPGRLPRPPDGAPGTLAASLTLPDGPTDQSWHVTALGRDTQVAVVLGHLTDTASGRVELEVLSQRHRYRRASHTLLTPLSPDPAWRILPTVRGGTAEFPDLLLFRRTGGGQAEIHRLGIRGKSYEDRGHASLALETPDAQLLVTDSNGQGRTDLLRVTRDRNSARSYAVEALHAIAGREAGWQTDGCSWLVTLPDDVDGPPRFAVAPTGFHTSLVARGVNDRLPNLAAVWQARGEASPRLTIFAAQDRWTSILHDAPLPGEAGALDQIEVSVGFFHRKASLLLVERHAETRAAHRLHVVDVGCRLGGYPMP